ncbi:alpha/beta hydrolase [Paraburkholderia sp. Ac-20336]|uniref:alpha/beta hydrolase n=1 Tax=Paraburkholderia sp. Ac-20336 TaxID=2703886 RepID=UPI00197E54E3|nr:alpha/beta fold hydrolase [Paraburkholderia sp. Ac-20336]MBN3804790.1 alpha/beta hydrolase [Paraburkholderia sp. Ac-20336]
MPKIFGLNPTAIVRSRLADVPNSAPAATERGGKQTGGILDGLASRNQLHASPDRPSTGLKKFMANQVFGNATDRKTLEPWQQRKIRVGIATGQIEPVKIKGNAGELAGHLYKATSDEKAGKVALVLSGSGEPAEMQVPDIADKYRENGVDVLAINYRGFGASEGTPSEKGLYQDAEAMLDHLTHTMNVPAENVLVHGYSMGGPVAAHLATKARSEGLSLGGLVLDRPMPSTSKGVRAHFPKIGAIPGQLAKQSVGALSVEKNLQGQPAGTKVVMMTDSDGLGREGELLRERLLTRGFDVSGSQVDAAHDESNVVMRGQFSAIQQAFLPSAPTRPAQPAVSSQRHDAPQVSEQDQFIEDFSYLKDYIQVS